MKRYTLIAGLLLLAVLGAACGATPEPTPVPPTPVPTRPPAPTDIPTKMPAPTMPVAVLEDEEIRNEDGGFIYRAIPGYTVEAFENMVFMTAPDADTDTGPLFLLGGESIDEEMPPDEVFDLFISEFTEDADLSIGDPRDITVAGAPGREVALTGDQDGQEIVGRIVVVLPSPTHFFYMLAGSPADRWEDEVEPLYHALLNTVQFFPPVIIVQPTVGPTEAGATPTEAAEVLPTVGPTVTPVPKPVVELESGWTTYSNGNYVQGLAFHNGLIWAATEGGVVAWNPSSGEAVKYTTLDGLPHNQVNAIISCPVPESRVIVGTKKGISVLNPTTDTWETLLPGDDAYIGDPRVESLGCGYDSRVLLIGYGGYGLHMWDSQTDEWVHVNKSDHGLGSDSVAAIGIVGDMEEIWTAGSRTVSRITGSGITVYTEDDNEILDSYITQIIADAAGNVWMGQFIDDRLIHFYNDTWTAYGPDNVDSYPFMGGAQGLDLAPDGTLWIVSSFGNVCQFDPGSASCLVTYEDEPGQVGFPVHSLIVDPQGNVYYGSNEEGISAFNGSTWTEFVLDDPLVSNNLQGLGLDHYGMLWIGTSVDGIQVLDPTDADAAWVSYTDLPSYSINTFYPSPWGGIWIGHSAGASFYDGANWTHFEEEDGILRDVESIATDGWGQIWFGTSDGISIWDGQSFTTMNEENGLPGDYVRAMLFDGQTTWVGIWGQGLMAFGMFDVMTYDESNGLPSNNIAALALDQDGSLLIGADDSIVRFSNGEFSVLYEADNWSALITTIVVAPNGDIWAGDLFDGAYHFDGSTWHHLTTADGLPTNQFYEGAIIVDHLGTVWFAGLDGGMVRYVP